MEKALNEAVEKAVTAAVNKAVPAAINQNFNAAVDEAVKEKMKEAEAAMEKKLKRGIRKNELEANLDAAIYMVRERRYLLEDLPDYDVPLNSKLMGGIRIKKELDHTRIRYFEGQLAIMKKEDENEKAKKANEERQGHV
ncbi:hypothetical protein KCU65_g5521, partial [Aureobasidium melanogenum]